MARAAGVGRLDLSGDYVYGRRPDVEARLDRFAETLVARARDTTLDEIVIVGHSMGRPSPSKSSRARLQSTRILDATALRCAC